VRLVGEIKLSTSTLLCCFYNVFRHFFFSVNLKLNGSQILAILVSPLHVLLFNFVKLFPLIILQRWRKWWWWWWWWCCCRQQQQQQQHMGNVKTKIAPVITQDNKFQKHFCICDEYVINLFVCIYEVRKWT